MFFTESGSNIGNATSLRGTDSAASFTVIPIHGEEMRCFRVCLKKGNPQVRVDFSSVQGINPKA